jgi:hypothetical protein
LGERSRDPLRGSLLRRVDDRVVDELRVEHPSEPHGPHVAPHLRALRVELSACLEHPRRKVDQRHLEVLLQW